MGWNSFAIASLVWQGFELLADYSGVRFEGYLLSRWIRTLLSWKHVENQRKVRMDGGLNSGLCDLFIAAVTQFLPVCYREREFAIFLATLGEFLLPRLLAPPFEIPGKFSRYEIAHRRERVGFFISFAYLYAVKGFSDSSPLRPVCPWFQAHARVLLESALTPKFPLRFSKPPLTTPVLVNTRESFEDK